MGVPKLLATLAPYSEQKDLDNALIVVDGPGLAYHAVQLCQAEREPTEEKSHPFDRPSYRRLGESALAWLDDLERRGNTISALFFDGYLPLLKRPTRLERAYRTSTQLKTAFTSHQRECPGFDTRSYSRGNGSLPAPAFTVPAVLDALRQSPKYGPLTKLVPGEADTFCAEHVRSAGRGTVITSDSDLLVHDLGLDGNVVFFRDIDLGKPTVKGSGDNHLAVATYSPAGICKRLSLDATNGMTAFAFELFMDSSLSLNQLVERAKQRVAVTAPPALYTEFLEQYESPNQLAAAAGNLGLNGLDPRVSEFILQGLLSADFEATERAGDRDILVFIPQLLESWTQSNAWEPSAPLRQCAFCLLQVVADRRIASVREYTRLMSLSSRGGGQDVAPLPELKETVDTLVALLRRIQSTVDESALQWVVLSAYQDIVWSRERSKTSVCLEVLCKETPSNGQLDRITWNTVHWLAQIQGTLYSLRMLQQVADFVSLEASATQLGGIPPGLEELRHVLSNITPIVNYPTLRTMQNVPAKLKEADALRFLSELADTPNAIAFQGRKKKKKNAAKKRKLSPQPTRPADTRRRSNPFALLDDAD